jgi:glycosyltransferase involved in cell wall biosynthesis
MTEEKRACVVIASVLKRFDDVRMFEKIGRTIAGTKSTVHCIGFGKNTIDGKDGVVFHSIGFFRRISIKRWIASWKVLKTTLRLGPTHFIITTHELLFTACVVKLMTGARVIYDVQENYYLNIKNTNAFPAGLKHMIAWYVRLKESIFSFVIDHFILAEKIYADQLPFVKRRFTVIENKVRRPVEIKRKVKDETIELIFTGILAESTGVFIAIELAEQLHLLDPKIRLTMVGFAPQPSTLKKLELLIRHKPYFQLIRGADMVSHERIIEEIQKADFGIISYPKNPSTDGRYPTKLDEYLAYELPILLIDNPGWKKLCEALNACIPFSYPRYDVQTILHRMRNGDFYSTDMPRKYWQDLENDLIEAVFNR